MNKTLISGVFLIAFFSLSGSADAAVLRMKPAQASVTVGNIVSIQVSVDTQGKVINNAESVIQFPTDQLEVVSIDNKSSIFNLWVENPSFSNSAGQVTFNGGIPNPGFEGANGTIISIVFRAKKAGTASVIFSNSAVRENDGLGTDILSGKSGVEIAISSTQAQPAAPVTPATPAAPTTDAGFVVTSSSHPNQSAWYAKDDIEMSWTLPKNATAVKTLLGSHKDSDPTVYYDSPLTRKSMPNIGDGTWYFHVSYLAGGVWSKTQHYRLQIDTVSPTDLAVRTEKDDTGEVTLYMEADDSLSGVDHYRVAVDSDSPLNVKSSASGKASVEIPFYRAGEHEIVVTVFDKAGNQTETSTTITTDDVSELRIDSYPATVKINENIEISGSAPYANASLRVSLRNSDDVIQSYKLKSNSYSEFNYISQPILAEGEYTVWVDLLKDNGEVSLSSQKVTISAKTPLLLQIGSYTIGLMKVLIPAALLLILFVTIVLLGWLKFFKLYRQVRKESRQAEVILGKSFNILRKDLKAHITKLKRAQSSRKLTSEEVEFLEQFEGELTDAESAIEKEVKEIAES